MKEDLLKTILNANCSGFNSIRVLVWLLSKVTLIWPDDLIAGESEAWKQPQGHFSHLNLCANTLLWRKMSNCEPFWHILSSITVRHLLWNNINITYACVDNDYPSSCFNYEL